jgi:hypothetical protein
MAENVYIYGQCHALKICRPYRGERFKSHLKQQSIQVVL